MNIPRRKKCQSRNPKTGSQCIMGENHFGCHRTGGVYKNEMKERWVTKCSDRPCEYHESFVGNPGSEQCIQCGDERSIILWKDMSDEDRRIAIAELCGYTDVRMQKYTDSNCFEKVMGIPLECTIPQEIPDYLNDLNAMHEAEKVVREDGVWTARYNRHLKLIMDRYNLERSINVYIIFAEAEQRAEAFYKTMKEAD